jgi:glutamate-1-semialdehyde 2,1-aminomutase
MKAYFIQEMLEKGFLASNLYYPMFAHTTEQVGSYLDAVEDVFRRMAALSRSGGLDAALRGRPAVSGFKRVT